MFSRSADVALFSADSAAIRLSSSCRNGALVYVLHERTEPVPDRPVLVTGEPWSLPSLPPLLQLIHRDTQDHCRLFGGQHSIRRYFR